MLGEAIALGAVDYRKLLAFLRRASDIIAVKTIVLTPGALKALGELPKAAQVQIVAKLKRYAETGAGSIKALVGRPGTRLRIGDYRAVFVEDADVIRVFAIGDRRDIYD